MYYLAIFEERIGETVIILAKIIKARNIQIANSIAEIDARDNSCYELGIESIRRLESIREIDSLEDIPVPFLIKEDT